MRTPEVHSRSVRGVLFLTLLSTSACVSLLEGVARAAADEAVGDTGPSRAPAPPPARTPRLADRGTSPDDPPPPTAVTSAYESAPMMGLCAGGCTRTYSLMGSLFDGPNAAFSSCRPVLRGFRDVLSAPEGPPVSASGPLGLRVSSREVPLYDFFTVDRDLRATRAFFSGAQLAGDQPTCGLTSTRYMDLAFGWTWSKRVAVSR